MHAGVADQIFTVDEYMIARIEANYCSVPFMVIPEFKALAERIMWNYCLDQPSNFEESLELFHILISALDQMLITT